MNYKLVVEVTFEELLNNYAEAVKTELGRDVEVKCVDTPISVGKVQSTEETTVNTPVETSKKTPKKKTQAKKKEPEVSNDVEETKPWVQNPEYQKLNNELKEVLDKMDLERNCFTPEYERLAKIMNEISAKITALINSYRSEETLARIHQQMLEEDKLEKSVANGLDIPNITEDTDSEPKEEEEETKPLVIPERSREIPADEVAPWEDKKEEKKEDIKEEKKEDKPKSLDELFPHRNDPSAPGLFSQFARND